MEFCLSGVWGVVCDNHWDIRDARVTCRKLGLPFQCEYINVLCGDGVHRPVGREAQVAHFPGILSLRVMKYFNSVWQWPFFIQMREVVMKVPRIASHKIWGK